MRRYLRRLYFLLAGCPNCGKRTYHQTYCLIGWDWKHR